MINNIYIFGNCGKLTELPKSGGQTSARRIIDSLRKSKFDVVPIRRHRAELEGKWKHQLEIMTFAVIDLLKIIAKIVFGNRKNSAFLHLTYAGPLVPYEFIITRVVRLLGYKSLIYLKGGQILDYYENGTERHRRIFKKTMDLQSKVFFEGMKSLQLVKEISKTPVVYFPNFVFEDQIPNILPNKPKDKIGLLYFGRVAPNKNIDVILDTFELLCQRHDNIFLTIIGGIGQSKEYTKMIDQRIANSKYTNKIIRMGITPFETIKEIMLTQHFFIFPSKERAEGHSNSLNEAMSQGLIPIVSNYHFNKSVVGNDLLVVDGYNPEDYAERIAYIIDNYDMQKLAMEMRQRVVDYFSYEVVNTRIYNELRSL